MAKLLPHDESYREVEAMIRAAGRYVEPTDDLRPRTLEAARDKTRQQRSQRRIGSLAAMVILLVVSGAPDFVRQALGQSAYLPAFATTHELQVRAVRRAADSKTGPDWALVDVFFEVREDQARRFGESL